MNILYIHQYFTTPEEPGGTRSYWISKELIKRGHKVIMITSTNNKHYNPGVEIIDGIEVHYLNNPYSNYMSIPRKLWAFINFVRLAIKECAQQKDIDLVFATSTPLTVGFIALFLKKVYSWRYVFEVRDLWPEFPIQIGAIKNKLLIWMLRKLEQQIYKQSEHIIALSPGMKEGVLSTGIIDVKCSIVPNMSKPEEFYPHEPSADIINQFNLDSAKFKVIHFGSMGVANGLEYIIEAAKNVKDRADNDIDFIFLGSGSTQPILENKVKEYALSNVHFLGNHNMKIVSEVVNCCDVTITTFKNLPILHTNSPNKLFDSLSAGKPVIVNSSGWTKDLVEQYQCGFYVNPDNPEDLACRLIEIKSNNNLLQKWGNNARKLSVEVFDKSILSARVADVLESVL